MGRNNRSVVRSRPVRKCFLCGSLCALALALVISSAGVARGYCRTTATPAPAGFNPAVADGGCWTDGVPLGWTQAAHIPYSIAASASRQVSLAEATRVAQLSFNAWNRAVCPGGRPNVVAYNAGPASDAQVASDCGLNACDPKVHAGAYDGDLRSQLGHHLRRGHRDQLVAFGAPDYDPRAAGPFVGGSASHPDARGRPFLGTGARHEPKRRHVCLL
jgi:hypothetical protein